MLCYFLTADKMVVQNGSLFEGMCYGKIRVLRNVNAYVSAYIICNLSGYVNMQSDPPIENRKFLFEGGRSREPRNCPGCFADGLENLLCRTHCYA
jgi:hypothetical protein